MKIEPLVNNINSQLKHDLVLASHILVAQKLDSGPFGNISVRIPGTAEFLINPCGVTFNQIKSNDILRIDLNGNILEGNKPAHPGEIIHRAIYQLRPDVSAIVHSHSINTVMQSLLGIKIEPYTQLGASIHNDQGIYSGFTGPVRSTQEGYAIAEALENYSIVIAKNHGLFTTSKSLPAALWDFIVCEQAAMVHLQAIQLGFKQAELISDEYLQKSKEEVRHKQFHFMWKNFVNSLAQNFSQEETP